ncbi:MAG: 5'/3'-nucleotidase SurE [Acidimicrobiales bacterium]
MTAANFGVSGLAVSIAWAEQPHWGTAARFAAAALEWLESVPVRTVLNLNLPDRPFADVRGVRWAELAAFGTVRAAVVSSDDGPLQMELRETGLALPPDTDTALVAAGYAAITAIVGVRSDDWQPVAAEVERRAAAAPGARVGSVSADGLESA